MVTLANWKWFSKWENEHVEKRGDEYDTMKSAFGKRIWNQVCEIYPQIRDKVCIGNNISKKMYC